MIWWKPFDWWFRLVHAGALKPQPDDTPPEERPPSPIDEDPSGQVDDGEPVDEDVTGPIELGATPVGALPIGAWTGSASIGSSSDMARDVAFAKWLGLSRLDVMVNDHSAKRQPRDFGTYNKAKIAAFCRRAVGEGIEVHLTTWCMPHEKYLRQLGAQMTELVGQCAATSIMLDAEEPWTLAAKPMPWEEAGELVGEMLGHLPFGVTGIGYASGPKLRPIVSRSQYMVPQCYATAGNTLNPKKAAVQLSNIWRSRFGDRRLVVGLAGYKQVGRPGYTKKELMTASFDAAKRAGASAVVYWSLYWFRQSRETSEIIRTFTASRG